MNHDEAAARNRVAWEHDAYRAWVTRYGTPEKAATAIRADPARPARRILPHIGDPAGTAIANPLGSHGRVATGLAVLGARVTVFDASASNARYARELADAANVEIEYVVGDFLTSVECCTRSFDAVVAELGIVHYFLDIERFARATRGLLRPGGLFVLNDFHPVAKKIIVLDEGRAMLDGSYFLAEPEAAPTPYGELVDTDAPDCVIRRWNLGEIITAFAGSGFRITGLREHPLTGAERLPGTFTLTAVAA